MEQLFGAILSTNGLFGLLTTFLIIYVVKSSEKRENKLITQNETREERLIKEKKDLLAKSEKREEKLHQIIFSFGERFDSIDGRVEGIEDKIGQLIINQKSNV